MEKKKITRENIADHLLEYQLNLIGKTIEQARQDPLWINTWSISQEKHDEFKKYAIQLLKKVFKYNTSKAKSTFDWFDLGFGLKIKQDGKD